MEKSIDTICKQTERHQREKFTTKANRAFKCERKKNRTILTQKLKAPQLTKMDNKEKGNNKVGNIKNCIKNMFTGHFPEEELVLLNKGTD